MRSWLLIIAISVIGCSEDDPNGTCVPADRALSEIASLENIVERGIIAGRPGCQVYTGAQIATCKYLGSTVYYFTNYASSNSHCVGIVYDCHGDELINWGDSQDAWNTFEGERTEEEVLWEKD